METSEERTITPEEIWQAQKGNTTKRPQKQHASSLATNKRTKNHQLRKQNA